jgi:hypothetical protein
MRNLFRDWRRLGDEARIGLAILLACITGIAGYITAGIADSATTTAAYVPPTPKQVTVQRTVIHRVKGTGRVVTDVRTVALPSEPLERVVTEQITRPGRDRVVTDAETTTVLQSQTIDRPVTVTTAVNGQTRTITERVTSPSRTVTATAPTQTITSTVTQPPRTVTETTTKTVTTTDTVTTIDTVTTTETVTVTVPCKKPC